MSTYNRYTNLTTQGNFGLIAAGLPVVSPSDGKLYDHPAGRLILFNPIENETIDAAGIAAADFVSFGVTHSSTGGILADEIRLLGHEKLNLCMTKLKIAVTPPEVNIPQIIDVDFGCTYTGEEYGMEISVDDFYSRSSFLGNIMPKLILSASSVIGGCEACSEEENCDMIACEFVNQINGTETEGAIFNELGHDPRNRYRYRPFTAVKKFGTTTTFTLTNEAATTYPGVCSVKGLKSLASTGNPTLVFTSNYAPGDATATLLEQIQTIIDQINVYLKQYGDGAAFLKRLDSCSYAIEINSCVAGLVLKYHDDADVTKNEAASFSALANSKYCKGCSADTTTTFACGIRFIVHPVELPCSPCFPPGQPTPSYYGRTIRLDMTGDGWNNANFRITEVQAQVLAVGEGYRVQEQEYYQHNGGSGRNYLMALDYYGGPIPLPQNNTAAKQASVATCDELYCIWSILSHTTNSETKFNSRRAVDQEDITYLNVPVGNNVTVAAAQTVLSAFAALNVCSLSTITCVE